MSLIDALAQKGINFVEGIGKGVQFVGKRAGIVPVQRPHDRRPGLVWRIPEPEDVPASERVTAASIFAHNQPVVVREYERAVVLDNGKLYAELPAGVFDVSKAPIKGIVEIIWVSLHQSQHRWGVGGVMTVDGVTVGAFGTMFLQVSDATKFVFNLVAGQQAYSEDKIENWVKTTVNGSMRPELARRDVRSLMLERDAFVEGCKQKLAPLFEEWGLQFKYLEVVELSVPPEYRQAVQDVTIAGFDRQKAIIGAQTDAEILQLTAQAKASARLMAGSADVQVFALMQAHGLDPVKMETVKTLMEYAKTPSAGGGGAFISGDLYKPQVFAMLSQVLIDPSIPGDIKQTLRQTFPQQSVIIPALPSASSAATPPPLPAAAGSPAAAPPTPGEQQGAPAEPPLTVQRVNQMLDNLDLQLSEGKISEVTYDVLRKKWEKKLLELQAAEPSTNQSS